MHSIPAALWVLELAAMLLHAQRCFPLMSLPAVLPVAEFVRHTPQVRLSCVLVASEHCLLLPPLPWLPVCEPAGALLLLPPPALIPFLFELEEAPPMPLVQRPLLLLLAPPPFLRLPHWMPSPPVILLVTMATVRRLLLFGLRR